MSNLIEKYKKTIVSSIVVIPLLFNVNTMYASDSDSTLSDIINNGKQVHSLVESNENHVSSNVVYDDEAKKIFEFLEMENNKAQQKNQLDDMNNIFQSPIMKNNESDDDYSIDWYRIQFQAVALGFNGIAADKAAYFLRNSLQDDPEDKTYADDSKWSNHFETQTSLYTTLAMEWAEKIDEANEEGKFHVSGRGTEATQVSNVGHDWYLSLGKISYIWSASKDSDTGKWTVYNVINDVYDFDHIDEDDIPDDYPNDLVAIVANHAADAQDAGAIVPYNISIYMKNTYTP
ncbi:hypothetical protein [Longirhabdus pacifica]|uniref:hypothetical protein n=1 Tax=Longirhabdus pacifica TaxID=2305227 RepID=UPI001008714D|nr:hypothetical protein [Longirhabdus pacifica]